MGSMIYEKLRAHIDTFPTGFPEAEDNASIKFLQRLFSPEEAELALHLNMVMDGTPGKTSRAIAEETGRTPGEAETLLGRMGRNGVVYLVGEGEATTYSLLGFFPGMFELNTEKFDPEFNGLVTKILKAMGNSKKKRTVPLTKIVPVNRSLSSKSKVYPYESVLAAIETSSSLCLLDCVCRSHAKVTESDCGRPIEVCLYLNEFADHALRIGKGRKVTREEAIEVVSRAEDAGLIHLASHSKILQGICSCCGCCCLGLQAVAKMKYYGGIIKSDFDLKSDSDVCTGCGLCVDRCFVNALSVDDGKIKIDHALCVGCGSCVYICPTDSLLLEKRPGAENQSIPEDFEELLGNMKGF